MTRDPKTQPGIACQEVRPKPGAASSITDRVILYFFGGGYAQGSPFEDLPITAALADFTGARVVVPHYRLAPENPYPAALNDGIAVYRALVDASAPSRLALAGESAGGNLALAVLGRARAEGLSMPCAAALLSPWADLSNAGDSIAANASRDPTLDPFMLEDFAAAYAAGADRRDTGISPLFGSFDSAWPPFMVTTGTRDLLMSQSVRLAEVLRRAGVGIDLRIWDGLWHVFEFYDELPEAARSLAQIAAFLIERFEAVGRAGPLARGT